MSSFFGSAGIVNAAAGPGAAVTDNAIVRWDGTSGTLLQNSLATISDEGQLAITAASGNTAAIVGTGSGTGAGVSGVGSAAANSVGVMGTGGAGGGNGGNFTGTGTVAAVYVAQVTGGYCLHISPDTTSPVKAPIHIDPQNAEPTGAHVIGDIYVTSAGVLKICTTAGTPGTWTSVGAQS